MAKSRPVSEECRHGCPCDKKEAAMGDIRKREASLPFRSIYGQEDSPASDAVPPIDDYTDIAAHGSYYFRSHGILLFMSTQ